MLHTNRLLHNVIMKCNEYTLNSCATGTVNKEIVRGNTGKILLNTLLYTPNLMRVKPGNQTKFCCDLSCCNSRTSVWVWFKSGLNRKKKKPHQKTNTYPFSQEKVAAEPNVRSVTLTKPCSNSPG